jgi:hypothetical protein
VVPGRPRTPGAPGAASALPRHRTAYPGHLPRITGILHPRAPRRTASAAPWIAALVGSPPAPATATAVTGHGGAHAHARLAGLVRRLLAAQRGERNQLLFWASLRAGELVADGDLDARAATRALTRAATQIGLADEDGQRAVAATVRSGFQRAGATYQPPDHPATDHPDLAVGAKLGAISHRRQAMLSPFKRSI